MLRLCLLLAIVAYCCADLPMMRGPPGPPGVLPPRWPGQTIPSRPPVPYAEPERRCILAPHSFAYYFIISYHGGHLAGEIPYTNYTTPKPEASTKAGATPSPTTTTTKPPITTTSKPAPVRALHALPSTGDFQKWSFVKATHGEGGVIMYGIVNKANGLALTSLKNATANGTFFLTPFTADITQLFLLIPASKHYYLILSVSSGKFVTNFGRQALHTRDLHRRHTFESAPLDEPHQLWRLGEAVCDPYPQQPYRIIHRLSNMPLGIANASRQSNVPVVTLANDVVDLHAQVMFKLVPGVDSVYHVQFGHSKKIFSVVNESLLELANVTQVDAGAFRPNEQFYIEKTGRGACVLLAKHSRRYLGITSQRIWQIHTRLVQQHKMVTQGAHFTFSRVPSRLEAHIAYRIRNRYSGQYMNVYRESLNPGAPISQRSYETHLLHQLFYVKPVGSHLPFVYYLVSKHSKLYIFADNKNNNTPVHQRPRDNTNVPQFTLHESKERHPNGAPKFYTITSVEKQPQVLQPIGGVKSSCVGITTDRPDPSNLAQQWEFIPEIELHETDTVSSYQIVTTTVHRKHSHWTSHSIAV